MNEFKLNKKEINITNPEIHSAAHILTFADTQPEDIITGLIRKGEQIMVFSSPGAGKSWFALSLAMATASGTSVAKTTEGQLKWQVPKQKKVLFVDGEMDVADLSLRLRGLSKADQQLSGLYFLPRQLQSFEAQFPNLADHQDAEDLVRHCIENKVELLVLDNLTTLAAVEDENSTSAFRPVIDGLLMRLKTAGIACVLVHHSNKGDSSFRGSSAIATTFNAIIHLKKNPMVKGEFTLRFTKTRNDHIEKQALTMQIKTLPDGSLELVSDGDVSQYELIAHLVKSLDYTSDAQVRKALAEQLGKEDVSESNFSKWKKKTICEEFISAADWKKCLLDAEEFASLPEL
jgi:RecA-family ATPase